VSPAAPGRRALSRSSALLAVSRHRTLLAAGLVAASVAAGLTALAPSAEARVQVLAAARDLPSGAVLAVDDLVPLALPAGAVPSGALQDAAQVVGRLVSGPVRRGEALTDVRLLGTGLLTGSDGVAVPVRLADPATAALVQAGDRVDVLSAPPEGASSASTVASGVTVLAVPSLADDPGEGALVVVAAPSAVAARLAAAAVTGRLSLAVRSR
jgi:Flp pilus assembly protein CpaB